MRPRRPGQAALHSHIASDLTLLCASFRHAALMRKRNAKGQPVMRYRVEGILEKLMREQQQGAGKR